MPRRAARKKGCLTSPILKISPPPSDKVLAGVISNFGDLLDSPCRSCQDRLLIFMAAIYHLTLIGFLLLVSQVQAESSRRTVCLCSSNTGCASNCHSRSLRNASIASRRREAAARAGQRPADIANNTVRKYLSGRYTAGCPILAAARRAYDSAPPDCAARRGQSNIVRIAEQQQKRRTVVAWRRAVSPRIRQGRTAASGDDRTVESASAAPGAARAAASGRGGPLTAVRGTPQAAARGPEVWDCRPPVFAGKPKKGLICKTEDEKGASFFEYLR